MNKLLSLLPNRCHDTIDTGLFMVSMVSPPFKGDTIDTTNFPVLRGDI